MLFIILLLISYITSLVHWLLGRHPFWQRSVCLFVSNYYISLSFYFGQFLQIVLGNRLDQISVILAKVKYKEPHKTVNISDFFLLKNVFTNCSDISMLYSIMIAHPIGLISNGEERMFHYMPLK